MLTSIRSRTLSRRSSASRSFSVNTLTVKPKTKRVRYVAGKTRSWKKAIVTLAEGDTIEVFGNQA